MFPLLLLQLEAAAGVESSLTTSSKKFYCCVTASLMVLIKHSFHRGADLSPCVRSYFFPKYLKFLL